MANTKITSKVIVDNINLPGTEGLTLPSGTTAQRPSSPNSGSNRFNTTTNLMEYYDGTSWKEVDNPPSVSSINPTTETDANANIVITGTNFKTGATVQFIGSDGTAYNSPSVTINSLTQITATTPSSALTVDNEPYNVRVTNSNGLNGTLFSALDAGSSPAFGVAAGTVGTLSEGANASGFTQITATDADGQSVSITLKSGSSLPSGVSMSTSGVFSGTTPTTGSDVTTTFTVQATDGVNTSERTYNMTVRAPQFVQLSGSGTWSVPSGVDSAEILIVGGGASGSKSPNVGAGGGGGGGIVHRASYTFTTTDKNSGIAYSVGEGGDGVGISPYAYDGGGHNGEDTTFGISGGTITAKGGGYGAGYGGNTPYTGAGFSTAYYVAADGGSGGGHGWNQISGDGESIQANFSGWTSYGNDGGDLNLTGSGSYNGGGGGGAGATGGDATYVAPGAGGVGQLFSSFTSYGESGYFGGGGGGGNNNTSTRAAGGNGGGGDGGAVGNDTVRSGLNATDGTGGGGGGSSAGGYTNFSFRSGSGGNGTILIKY